MKYVNYLIHSALICLVIINSYSQSTLDFKYSLGGYLDLNMQQSSLVSERTNLLKSDFEIGSFLSPDVLIGINWNYDGIKFFNGGQYKDRIWLLNCFYRKEFNNRIYFRMDIGYGRHWYKSDDKYPVERHILNLCTGAGMLIDVTNQIKIPVSVNYNFRIKLYSFLEQEKNNLYLHYFPIKLGIIYHFHLPKMLNQN